MSRYSIQKEYSRVVLLELLRCGFQPENTKNAVFLKQEIGIADQSAAYRRLVKAGLCREQEGGSLCLTDAGNAYLDRNSDQTRFFHFASPFVSIVEYRQAKLAANESASFEDVMLSVLEKKMAAFLTEKSYMDAQCTLFDTGCIHEMAGRPAEAFVRYAGTLFMGARGAEYAVLIEKFRAGKVDRSTVLRTYNGVSFAPKLLDGLRRLHNEYRDDTVDQALQLAAVPSYLCTDDELRLLLDNILNDRFEYMVQQIALVRRFNKLISAGRGNMTPAVK